MHSAGDALSAVFLSSLAITRGVKAKLAARIASLGDTGCSPRAFQKTRGMFHHAMLISLRNGSGKAHTKA